MYGIRFSDPILLSSIFDIPADFTSWGGSYHKATHGWTPDRQRASFGSWQNAMSLKAGASAYLEQSFGIYLLAMDIPSPSIYVGIAAEGERRRGGILNRIKKHRVKITGSHVGATPSATGAVHHPENWRDFAISRRSSLLRSASAPAQVPPDQCHDVRLVVGSVHVGHVKAEANITLLEAAESCLSNDFANSGPISVEICRLLWNNSSQKVRLITARWENGAPVPLEFELWNGYRSQCCADRVHHDEEIHSVDNLQEPPAKVTDDHQANVIDIDIRAPRGGINQGDGEARVLDDPISRYGHMNWEDALTYLRDIRERNLKLIELGGLLGAHSTLLTIPIIRGLSGTGKTACVKAFAESIEASVIHLDCSFTPANHLVCHLHNLCRQAEEDASTAETVIHLSRYDEAAPDWKAVLDQYQRNFLDTEMQLAEVDDQGVPVRPIKWRSYPVLWERLPKSIFVVAEQTSDY